MTRRGTLPTVLLACLFTWVTRFADAVDEPWDLDDPLLSGD
jgi:hypothetical protein